MRDRYKTLDYLKTLDPKKDDQEIHQISSDHEFPWDYGRGLEIAIWRTCCVPRISKMLDQTGEFGLRAQKRYDDTRILLGEIVRGGYDSKRGRQAISQINLAHRRFDIDNDDMRYVLSTFIFEPIRWINRWAWRPISETEKLAAFYFYISVGQRMNIQSLPADRDEFEQFNLDYERANFAGAECNGRVGRALLELYSSWYPWPTSTFVATMLPCRLDRPAREALGMSEPSPWIRGLNRLALRGHGLAERAMPTTMARIMTRPTARTYPGYPHGYDLADIGPAH
ncbi:oxygenase MpaB family protein [Frankia sp. AgB32]|uniref:oxygenase MpaB family protein n=1 Tax=Frankia sp. AgB32 TaxID=631119 RepID=UPI00200BF3CB|nr:oxygenase MpaB family protein [Frankia sp. AgB32]MCK9896358.1 DUF2236 domain-containing protein [Frankia sp. AgB32]